MMRSIKKSLFFGMLLLIPSLFAFNAGATAPQRHPDGGGLHLRGWGPTVTTDTGYKCNLYDDNGRLRGTLENAGNKGILSTNFASMEIQIDNQNQGLLGEFPIDDYARFTFPDLDAALAQVKQATNHDDSQLGIQVWAGRMEVGKNMEMVQESPNLGVTSLEFRCVYIVDKATGMPLFCLNCSFFIS